MPEEAKPDGTGPDRKLPALLAAFGFALALAAYLVVNLISAMNSEPTRINFAFVGDEEGTFAAFMLNTRTLRFALMTALAGALLGWWAGVAAARRGWRISRGDGG